MNGEPRGHVGIVESLIHGGFGSVLSSVALPPGLLQFGLSLAIAVTSAIIVHFVKLLLERWWPRKH